MSGEWMTNDHKHSRHLPPPDVWVHNPYTDGLLPTPIDGRGLVDTKGLISLMRSTVDSSYNWQSPFSDEHHLQWPNRWYDFYIDDSTTEQVFRNLPMNKVRMPRVLHSWIHRTTEPPEKPSHDAMRYQIEAQQVALSLFRVVREPKRLARHRDYDQEGTERLLNQRFDAFASICEQAKLLPPEFQIIDSDYTPRDIVDMQRIGAEMGRYAFAATPTRLIQGLAA
jgi:hypothetical protein